MVHPLEIHNKINSKNNNKIKNNKMDNLSLISNHIDLHMFMILQPENHKEITKNLDLLLELSRKLLDKVELSVKDLEKKDL